MKYKDEDLKKVQKIELEILQEIIRICDKNDIAYFAHAGTLLGTVRHDGFIPWDDDIDIGMMRDDYEKFIRIAPAQLKKGYSLQHFSVEPATPTYHAKVRKDGTLFIENYTRDIKMHHGIFVDIMPYDYIPDDEKERSEYRRKASLYKQLFIAKTTKETTTFVFDSAKRKVLSAGRHLLHWVMKPVPKAYLFRKYDLWLKQNNSKKSSYISTRAIRECDNLYTDFFPLQKHRFENIMINVPNHADVVLKNCYGDYMALPPVEKRITHSPYKIDFGPEQSNN